MPEAANRSPFGVAVEAMERRLLLAAAPTLPLRFGQWLDVPGANSVVHDAGRDLLLIAADTGLLHRYDLGGKRFLDPWEVGAPLLGADLSADGRYLYAGSSVMTPAGPSGVAIGTVYKVRLSDGDVDAIPFAGAPGEAGVRTVAAAADGVYFTTTSGAERTPVRRLNPTTGAVAEVTSLPSVFSDGLWNGVAVRSGDRGLVLFTDASGSATYEPASGKHWSVFGPGTGTRAGYGPTSDPNFTGADAAVNRDGTLVVPNPLTVYDRQLNFAHVGGYDYGVVFHPQRDMMYLVGPTSIIQAIDTDGWQSGHLVAVDPFYNGFPADRLPGDRVIADDTLYVANGAGVFVYRLFSAPEVLVPGPVTGPGETVDVTVSAQFLGGYTDTSYRGTVRLTSTDRRIEGLPDQYTFTADDNGEHTFQVRFGTGGVQRVTAADVRTGAADESNDVDVDTVGPTATVSPGLTPLLGSAVPYQFQVAFFDARGVDAATLGAGDVVVIDPRGAGLPVRLLPSEYGSDGEDRTIVARFEIDPPGGRWDPSDAGTYTLRLAPAALADKVGNLSAAGDAGTFEIGLPTAAPDLVIFAAAPQWPGLAFVGQRVKATATLTNAGTGPAPGQFIVQLFASEDEAYDPMQDMSVVTQFVPGPLAPGESKQVEIDFAVPSLSRGGLWYLLPHVQNYTGALPESDPTNNAGSGPRVPMAAAYADVVVSVVAPPPDVVARGRAASVRLRLENMGSMLTRGGYGLQLFRQVSIDPDPPRFQRLAAVVRRITLRPGAVRVVTVRLRVPKRGVDPGPHFLGVGFGPARGYTDADDDNSFLAGPVVVTV